MLGWGKVDETHSAVRLQETQVKKTISIPIKTINKIVNTQYEVDIQTIKSQVRILSNADCQGSTNTTIHSSMLCAGGDDKGTNEVG